MLVNLDNSNIYLNIKTPSQLIMLLPHFFFSDYLIDITMETL
jgi:hypothetical protein